MSSYKLNIPQGAKYTIEHLPDGEINILVTGNIDNDNWKKRPTLRDLLWNYKLPSYVGFVNFTFKPRKIDMDIAEKFISSFGDVKDTEMPDEYTYNVYYEAADDDDKFPRKVARKANGKKFGKYTANVVAPSKEPQLTDGWVLVSMKDINERNLKVNLYDSVIVQEIAPNQFVALIESLQNGSRSFDDWSAKVKDIIWKNPIEIRELRPDDIGVIDYS